VRLLIDGRPLVGNRTGIGVHTAEIAQRLDLTPPPIIATHAEIADRSGIEQCTFRVDPMPLGVAWQQWKLPRIDADVLWGPHGTLPITWKRPSVVTIHDLTSITMPGLHRLKTILSFNLFIARSVEQASYVACVSRAVADETIRGFGVPSHKVEIVPNGVDEFFSPDPNITDGDYILFAGTLEPRKGVNELVAAWRSLPAPRPRLVLCGGVGWKIKVPHDPGIEATGYVTRERLRELYRGALAFVYPSLYEGFGIPPLEAMACGAPVIATRTGAIEDFAEENAMFVEPGDFFTLRAALREMINNTELRRALRERGPAQANLWRWERGARVMQELIACA
jgi:alpha-1,3-rhamnosyl/mannosyltransferase